MAEPGRVVIGGREYIHLAHDRRKVPAEKRGKFSRAMWIALMIALFAAVFSLMFHPVTLTWQPSTTTAPNLEYNVYRADSPCLARGTPRKIATTRELRYTDMSIKFGTFCYSVRSSVNEVESVDSNTTEVKIRPSWRHR